MTILSDKLRAGLVALLAFVLLLGPCVSMTNMVLAGSAQALETNSDDHIASSSAHDHHGHAHGLVSHHAGGEGDKAPSCDDMCDSWGVQKSKRDLSAAIADRAPDGDDGDDFSLVALTPSVLSPQDFSIERSRIGAASQDSWLAGIATYRVTNRFRL